LKQNKKLGFAALGIIGYLTVGGAAWWLVENNDDETTTKTTATSDSTDQAQANMPSVSQNNNTASQQTTCLTALDNATVECGSDFIVIESNGLPNHLMMTGILEGGWNGQWPVAQDYTGSNAFRIPTTVQLASSPTIAVKNAAGVTANGIPMFLPQSPGRAGDDNCVTYSDSGECLRDPVADGEMDECGGHTGRGNDYHYHGPPTCMLEQLDKTEVAGYMMDGIPIYQDVLAGSKPVNDCGGYESPDGTIHYAFSSSYPYVTNCLLGEFAEGPSTSGSSVYTGNIDAKNSGSITDFVIQDDGCQTMTFSSGQSLTHCPS